MLNKVAEVLMKATDAEIEIKEVFKYGEAKKAICATRDGEDAGMLFYEDDIEEALNKAGGDFYEATLSIVKAINEYALEGVDYIRSTMSDWESARDSVIACLRKKTIGSGQVTREFVDMEEYVRVDFDNGTVVVTDEVLEKWGVSEEELFAQAEKNMVEYGFMGLSKMLGYDDGENDVLFFLGAGVTKPFGAGVICNKNVLEDVRRRMNDNFYVIPSSIHEVLVVSSTDVEQLGADDIRSTIGIINQKEVADDEVLSNNLYEYTAKHGLRIAG